MKSKVSYAVAVILGGASFGAPAIAQVAATAGPTTTGTDTKSEGLTEITVTAQRRSESMQNVPISMQAFTA
jgi:iron complex outermembrane recepter protein